MKKVVSMILVVLLGISLTACATLVPATSAVPASTQAEPAASAPAQAEPAADDAAAAANVPEQPAVLIKCAWAEPLDPNSHPGSLFMNIFKEEIEGAGLNMTVELYPSDQLGDAASRLKQVQEGIIQVSTSITSALFASNYNLMDYLIIDIPYLFSDDDEVVKVFTESEVIKKINQETIDTIGVTQMFPRCEGFRVTTNNKRELRTPEDFKGLKIRTTQNYAHMAMMEAMGAIPTPISYAELYTALQTNVVDGQENPPLNIELQKFNEVQKYLIVDNHTPNELGTVVNWAFYQSLTAEQRAAFDAAGKKAADAANEMAKQFNATAIQSLEDAGMIIYYPTDEELAMFRDATVDAVCKYIEAQIDHPEIMEEFLAEVDTLLGR